MACLSWGTILRRITKGANERTQNALPEHLPRNKPLRGFPHLLHWPKVPKDRYREDHRWGRCSRSGFSLETWGGEKKFNIRRSALSCTSWDVLHSRLESRETAALSKSNSMIIPRPYFKDKLSQPPSVHFKTSTSWNHQEILVRLSLGARSELFGFNKRPNSVIWDAFQS
jgi:hypothetical protein